MVRPDGIAIKKLRELHQINPKQIDFAKACGISRRIFQDIESGKPTTFKTLQKIATYLQIDAASLLTPADEFDLETDEDGYEEMSKEIPKALFDKIGKAQKKVMILQTWLADFPYFDKYLRQAVKNGASLEILILDHQSPMFKTRVREYYMEDEPKTKDKKSLKAFQAKNLKYVQNELYAGGIETLKRLYSLKQRKGQIVIKKYRGSAVISLHMADDEMYVGTFWRGKSTIEGPQIKVNRSGYFGRRVLKHFNLIWEDPTTIELSPPQE